MKRAVAVMLGSLAGVLLMPGGSGAEPAGVSVSLPILNAYVWRGQVLNEEPVIQPGLTVTKGGFEFSYFGNFNLTDDITGESGEFSEHDLSIAYKHACPLIEGANIAVGVAQYDFPNQLLTTSATPEHPDGISSLVADTREAFVKYELSHLLLKPRVEVYYDFKAADGFYGLLGVKYSRELCKVASLDLGATIGGGSSDYNAYYFGVDDTALNDATVSASIPWKVCSAATLRLGVAYSWLLDGDIEDGAESLYKATDQVIGSLALEMTL